MPRSEAMPVSQVEAVQALIELLRWSVWMSARDEAMATLALRLAAEIDVDATAKELPSLARELRATIDALPALKSFVLPGGSPAAAALHLARTICRRAEREAVRLVEAGEPVSGPALRYLNRLSDFLFVAARWANGRGDAEVFWVSGATR